VLETRTSDELPTAGDVIRGGIVAATQLAAFIAWALLTVWILLSLLRWLG
jgi:hypothetical protein